jgi:RecA-family ATPase
MIQVMSTVEEGRIDFVWKPYIPRGVLTICAGEPGVGKSSLSYHLAADLSAGRPLAGEDMLPKEERKVLLFSSEDDPSIVIRPRLEKHGANLDNIATFDFDNYGFRFDEAGLANLEMMLVQFKPHLVIFDPIVEFIGNIDMFRANEVRKRLSPLRDLIASYDVGCLIVAHVAKSGTGEFLHDIVGSQDFGAIIRSAMGVYRPEDSSLAIMKHTKANLTELGKTRKFDISNGSFTWDESLREREDRFERELEKSKENVVDFAEAARQKNVPI